MSQQLTRIPDDLRSAITKMGPQFQLVLPKHVSAERFTRILFTSVQRNARLLECTRDSIFAAMMTAAENGLLPDGRQGALVPFRAKGGRLLAQFIPMWQGLLDLARQSGLIADAYVASVRENDEFEYELGLDRKLKHKPAMKDRGEIVMVYAVVQLKDGTKTFGPGPMTVEEVEGIRQVSRAKDSGPWVDWWEQMAWKTVLKRTLKYVPQSPELNQAIETDDGAEFGQWETAPLKPKTTPDDEVDLRAKNIADIRQRINETQGEPFEGEVKLKEPQAAQDDSGRWYATLEGGEIEYWDSKIHASSKALNADGSFRKRRGAKANSSETESIPSSPSAKTMIDYISLATTEERVEELEDESRNYEFTTEEKNEISMAAKERKFSLANPD